MSVIDTLLPNKTLRVAINFGNAVLAQKISETEFEGVSVSLARYICKELGLTPDFKFYQSAGSVVDDAANDAWDIAFLARDKQRAEHIGFTSPYVVIEGAYLVHTDSPYRVSADIDQAGLSLSVGKNAAYDLYLTRTLQHAEIIRAPTTPLAVDYFIEQNLTAGAGVRAPLLRFAEANPQYRVLDDSFMSIEQALAFHRSLLPLRETLQALVEQFKAQGLARQALDHTEQFDAEVAQLDRVAHYEVI